MGLGIIFCQEGLCFIELVIWLVGSSLFPTSVQITSTAPPLPAYIQCQLLTSHQSVHKSTEVHGVTFRNTMAWPLILGSSLNVTQRSQPHRTVIMLQFVCLWSYLCVCDLICVSVILFVSLWPYLCVCDFICVSVILFVCLWPYLCVCDLICVSVTLFACLWPYLLVCDLICVSETLFVCLWSYLCVCDLICVSVI
jgi:hypothetical protein